MIRKKRDADTDPNIDKTIIKRDRSLYGMGDFFSKRKRAFQGGCGRQNGREFITAQAGDRIGFTACPY